MRRFKSLRWGVYKYYWGIFFIILIFTVSLSYISTSTLLNDSKFLPSKPKSSAAKVNTKSSSHQTNPTPSKVSKNPVTTSISTFAIAPSWSQNFSTMTNGPLNSKLWGYDIGNGGPSNPGWGNDEQEYYTNSVSNARIENGNLVIEALNQSSNGFDYTSARINTLPSLNFTYGKLDIEAELPSGIGTWPAMWLLPSDGIYALTTTAGEQDPNNYLRDGEIDMVEATGSIPGQITSSAQSYEYNPGNNERVATLNLNNDTTSYHDYELQWTPSSLTFLVDGVAYHTVNKAASDTYLEWPYNQPFYLILNIAMGGTEGGTETQQYPPYGIDNSSGPWEMLIKSINYYPYN